MLLTLSEMTDLFSSWPIHSYMWYRRDGTHLQGCWECRTGGWTVAQSLIMITTITLKQLKKRGYVSLLDMYFKLNPPVCDHLYTACPAL